MVVLEVVIATLVLALGIVATAGLYVGLLGYLGVVFHVAHCERCGHLWITSAASPLQSCPSCNHPRLLHPVHALHHEHLFHRGGSSVSAHR